jgi:hypothetical protein
MPLTVSVRYPNDGYPSVPLSGLQVTAEGNGSGGTPGFCPAFSYLVGPGGQSVLFSKSSSEDPG